MSKNRRKNGEGSIFKIAENKWIAKIGLGTRPDGRPNIKQFSGKTEAIVKKKLKDFKNSLDYAEKHMPSSYTVESYFSMWLKECQYHKLKPLSYDRLESTVMNHIYPNIGGMKIDKVTREQIQALINTLYAKKKLSYSSVKKVYVALNSCYKYALIDDIVLKNPCLGVILPSPIENTKQITALTTEETERLKGEISHPKSYVEGYTFGAAYLLILNTGLRMGEALSLRWDDVDYENRTITIRQTSTLTKKRDENGDLSGGYELLLQNSPKSSSGNRTIPINKSAEDALRTLKSNNETPYVIVNSKKNQVLPSNFERGFHTILKNANIKKSGVHVLRHTFASMLFSKGVDVKIVSKLLGHSTVKITYDIYVHLFEKDISHVTNVLD